MCNEYARAELDERHCKQSSGGRGLNFSLFLYCQFCPNAICYKITAASNEGIAERRLNPVQFLARSVASPVCLFVLGLASDEAPTASRSSGHKLE